MGARRPVASLAPVPAETYRMPGGGAGAVHTWQGADTGKYISAIRGGKIKRFDNHLHQRIYVF